MNDDLSGSYRVVNGIVVEEGLMEWYNITWDDDEEREEELEIAQTNKDGGFSLFGIIGE